MKIPEYQGREILHEYVTTHRGFPCFSIPEAEEAAFEPDGQLWVVKAHIFSGGELDGSASRRVNLVSAGLATAGFKPGLDNIRAGIWRKLRGNLTFNPINSLAQSTSVDICNYSPSPDISAAMIHAAQAVSNTLGFKFRMMLEKRIAGAEKVRRYKTSMLRDVEAGRAAEDDALVGTVVQLARLTDTPTSHIDIGFSLVKLLAGKMEIQRGRVSLRETAGAV